MTTLEKKTLVVRYFEELWNLGDTTIADEIIAPDFGCMRGVMSGPEAVKLYVDSYRTTFPRTHFTVLSIIAQGDLVTVCWASEGTHRSAFGHSCPSCGSPVTGVSVYRIEEGRIAECWTERDEASRFQSSSTAPCTN